MLKIDTVAASVRIRADRRRHCAYANFRTPCPQKKSACKLTLEASVTTKKFRYSVASPQGLFPLTPALPLGERENPRPAVGEASVAKTFESRELLFPLPEGGSGRGESSRATMQR